MEFLKKLWRGWMKAGLFIGNIISSIVLTIFYFTLFALFAVPFKLFSKKGFYRSAAPDSNWLTKSKTVESLGDFEAE